MKLSERVKKLEEDNYDLRSLCGMILATIAVNRERKLLTSADENHFSEIIKNWEAKYKELTNYHGKTEETSE